MIRQVEKFGKDSTYSGDYVLAVAEFSFGKKSDSVGQGEEAGAAGGYLSAAKSPGHCESVLESGKDDSFLKGKLTQHMPGQGICLFGVQ